MPHVRTDIETEDNQSFETLENVLKKVKPGCGINVEIKYPQLKLVSRVSTILSSTFKNSYNSLFSPRTTCRRGRPAPS